MRKRLHAPPSGPTPTCRCCSTAGTWPWPAAIPCGRWATGATASAPCTSRDARLDVVAGVKADLADTLTAWPRADVLRPRRRRRRPRRLLRGLAGYDGWVVVEQDRVLAVLNGSLDGAIA